VFLHIVIHHPKPEYVEEVLASMRRVDAAAAGTPGLIAIGPWRSDSDTRLMGFAAWETEDAFHAARERIFSVAADDPFDVWLARPPQLIMTNAPDEN
jgi:heme-degrading monooxygenase HmoA